jgi:aminoglycoside/choline kinase family phosphotransferase
MTEITKFAKDLLKTSTSLAKAQLAGVQHLAGDASSRRFIRLQLAHPKIKSVILMMLSGDKGPLVSGDNYPSQDQSFIDLARVLRENGLNVPTLFLDASEHGALLVEDMGSLPLWKFTLNQLEADGEQQAMQLGSDYLNVLYRKALEQQKLLAACKEPDNCIALKRHLAFEQYRAEAERFITFYLEPNGVKKPQRQAISEALDYLCESICSHPKTLIHRDFMPWNLFVKDSEVYVLDFQDALQGSYIYDLVSLIHDRDADFALGQSKCRSIIEIYKQLHPDLPKTFSKHYHEILLQRYFRLAGQFHMLTKKTGNSMYQDWVPGCFRRLSQALKVTDYMQDALDILYQLSPELREGLQEDWHLV